MSSVFRSARVFTLMNRVLSFFAAAILFTIMWLTVVDVIGRDVFNVSITGLFEVIEILMGVLVFAGLPVVTAKQGHVSVTLLDSWVTQRIRKVQRFIINLICAGILTIFSWRLFDVAERLANYNDVTLFAKIPLSPVAYFMAVLTLLSVFVQLILTCFPHFMDPARNNHS